MCHAKDEALKIGSDGHFEIDFLGDCFINENSNKSFKMPQYNTNSGRKNNTNSHKSYLFQS